MPTTTNYAWPTPAFTDPPNGPAQITALAAAADTTVKSIDTRTATIETSRGAGIVGGRIVTGTNNLGGAIGGAETAINTMTTPGIPTIAGRRYRALVRLKVVMSAAASHCVCRVHVGPSAGIGQPLIREYVQTSPSLSIGFTMEFTADYDATASGTVVFTVGGYATVGTAQFVGGGSGTTNALGIEVSDVGPTGLLTVTAS